MRSVARQLPGGPCGVWMTRCNEVVVLALAILEAGGVYLPCDDRLPWARVSYMLTVASAQLLVAGEEPLQGYRHVLGRCSTSRVCQVRMFKHFKGDAKRLALCMTSQTGLET